MARSGISAIIDGVSKVLSFFTWGKRRESPVDQTSTEKSGQLKEKREVVPVQDSGMVINTPDPDVILIKDENICMPVSVNQISAKVGSSYFDAWERSKEKYQPNETSDSCDSVQTEVSQSPTSKQSQPTSRWCMPRQIQGAGGAMTCIFCVYATPGNPCMFHHKRLISVDPTCEKIPEIPKLVASQEDQDEICSCKLCVEEFSRFPSLPTKKVKRILPRSSVYVFEDPKRLTRRNAGDNSRVQQEFKIRTQRPPLPRTTAEGEGSPLRQCPHCDFRCKLQISLKVHQRQSHGVEKRYQCRKCSFSSLLRGDLKHHFVGTHSKK